MLKLKLTSLKGRQCSVDVASVDAAKAYVLGMGDNLYAATIWPSPNTSYTWHKGIGWQVRQWPDEGYDG